MTIHSESHISSDGNETKGKYFQWSVEVNHSAQSSLPKEPTRNRPSGKPRTIFDFPHNDHSIKGGNTVIVRQQWIFVSRISGFFLTWL